MKYKIFYIFWVFKGIFSVYVFSVCYVFYGILFKNLEKCVMVGSSYMYSTWCFGKGKKERKT